MSPSPVSATPPSGCGKTAISPWTGRGSSPSGMAIAASMLDRHHTLTRFLITLGVDPKVAEEDACKIEHDISDETFAAICAHAVRHGEKK